MIAQPSVSHPASSGRRGRPAAPLEPSASAAARLGAELRGLRTAHGLTLTGFGVRIGYSAQYVSQVEHGRNAPSEAFVRACDVELGGGGALMGLLPAVILEQAQHRSARVAARRGTSLGADEEDDVDPINRRELAAAGAAAGLRLGLGVACAPMSARDVDPALPEHSLRLLAIIGTHDAAHGAHAVLGSASRELRLIAAHRRVANGDLRVALMAVEARWAVHAAWLCEDTGDRRGRDALLDRALRLARAGDHPDLIAWSRARQAQWTDPSDAVRIAETGLRTARAGAQDLEVTRTYEVGHPRRGRARCRPGPAGWRLGDQACALGDNPADHHHATAGRDLDASFGLTIPALLVGWAAFEIAYRHAFDAVGVDPHLSDSTAVLKTLLSLGYLASTGEQSRLEQLWNLRNHLAHGYSGTSDVSPDEIVYLLSLSEELLANLEPSAGEGPQRDPA